MLFNSRGVEFPTVPDKPSYEDAKAALRTLEDLIGTFPFVSETDKSVALSGILTACVRRTLRAAPIHGYTAPLPGSGKSKLVDIASVIATGREAGVIAQGATEEELEKRLSAALLAGDFMIAIDNCEAPLGGTFLCQVCTQINVKPRILGHSKIPSVSSNAFITATGNNLAFIGDATRRALLCSLDPKEERPELREFAFDSVEMAKAGRGKYVMAALAILRAFFVAGRPRQKTPLGSFEEWSSTVRDALLWLEHPDPVESMEAIRENDPRRDELQTVIAQWQWALGASKPLLLRWSKRQIRGTRVVSSMPNFEKHYWPWPGPPVKSTAKNWGAGC